MSILYLFLSCLNFVKKKLTRPVLIVVVLIMCLIATFRDASLPDYESYYNFRVYELEVERLEPGAFLIRDISIFFSDSVYLFFFIYALIAIVIKVVAIHRLTDYVLLSLTVYLAIDFPSHEMIQIRAAVAMGFLLLSIPYIYKKKIIPFLIIVFVGTIFHYTALLAIPLYFFNPKVINKKREIIVVVLSFILGVLGIGITYIVEYIPIDFIQNLYFAYKFGNNVSGMTSVFSITMLFLFIIQIFMIYYVEKIFVNNKYIILLVKIQTISICSFFLLFDVPTVAGRVSEFYRIAYVISLPLIIPCFKQPAIGKLLVILICTTLYIRCISLLYI